VALRQTEAVDCRDTRGAQQAWEVAYHVLATRALWAPCTLVSS
jgi:hypothetical protein